MWFLDRTEDGPEATAAVDEDDVLLSRVRNRIDMMSQIDGIVVNNAMKNISGVS